MLKDLTVISLSLSLSLSLSSITNSTKKSCFPPPTKGKRVRNYNGKGATKRSITRGEGTRLDTLPEEVEGEITGTR